MAELPKGWEIKKLGECFKLKSGDALTSSMMNEGLVPVFGGNGIAGFHNDFNLSGSNVIIGRVGALCGRVRHITEQIWLTDNAFQITGFNYEFDHSFLTYLLNFKNLRNYARQAAQPVISNSSLKEVILEFPKSLHEQHRIVSILDEAFAAIAKAKANAEQNLKNTKALFESYLQNVFSEKGEGWEEKTLGEVCEYDKTPNNKKNLPYVGLEDIQSNTGKLIGPMDSRSVKSLTFHFNNEHVLYGRLRPYLNKVLLPDFEGHCSTEIFPVKPKKDKLERGFLFRWLKANETMNKINATWTGATLPRANMNTVLEFKINLPSIKAQQSIVQKLDALSAETKKLEAIYQKKIADLEELKKSILQKAFNGELSSPERAVYHNDGRSPSIAHHNDGRSPSIVRHNDDHSPSVKGKP